MRIEPSEIGNSHSIAKGVERGRHPIAVEHSTLHANSQSFGLTMMYFAPGLASLEDKGPVITAGAPIVIEHSAAHRKAFHLV